MDKALLDMMYENFKEVYRSEIRNIEKEILKPDCNMRMLRLNREALLQELQSIEVCQRHFRLLVM